MSYAECYPDKAPKVDDLMDTLCNHLRREVIYYFESGINKKTVPLEDVITHINARVPETTATEIRVSLQHVHLPKLKKRDWIDYDTRTGDIRYRGHESANELLGEVSEMFEE